MDRRGAGRELESRGERAGKKKAAMVSRLEELDRERGEKKRPREDDNERTLGEVDGAAAELVCAITQELPVDPVTARDGRVYERAAIEKWFAKGKSGSKSPVTNEPMGRQLLPAVQVRNMIERMVKSGALKGEKVDAWVAKIEIDDKRAKTFAAANGGDVDAMLLLHEAYSLGNNYLGFEFNGAEYVRWAKKASDAGSAIGTCLLAHHYELGYGMEGKWKKPNRMLAMHLYTRSAMDGCAKACYVLGERFAKGWKADKLTLVDRDYDAAALWLRKAADLHASTPEPEVDVADVQLYDDDSTWMNEWLAWNEERKAAAGS